MRSLDQRQTGERAALGSALLSIRAAEHLCARLTPAHFTNASYRAMFTAVAKLVALGLTPDKTTTLDFMLRRKLCDDRALALHKTIYPGRAKLSEGKKKKKR